MEDSARTIFPLEKFMMQPLSKKMLFCIFFHVIDRAILVSFFLREGARNGNLEFRFLLKTFAYNNPCNVETFDSLDIHFTLLETEIPRHFFLIYSFYCWWWWCIFFIKWTETSRHHHHLSRRSELFFHHIWILHDRGN